MEIQWILYTGLIWSAKNFASLLEAICATINLRIQELNHIQSRILIQRTKSYTKHDADLKDVILALSWGAQKQRKLNASKRYQLQYSTYDLTHGSQTS